MSDIEYGRSHISAAFSQALQTQSAALMPYFTLGYPDRATSLDVVEAIAPYCDLIELGVPFSDPLADGPTVQHSTQISLENGTTSADCLAMVRELRQRGVTVPFMLMGYYNPILAYGQEQYVADAKAAGADGFIVPDLPPEEADELQKIVQDAEMALVYLLAPTSNDTRIELVSNRAEGFIYLVSVTGVTGARTAVKANLSDYVNNVRAKTGDIPLAVGFGISNPTQAAAVGAIAEGVIVGSALINATDAVASNKAEVAAEFVKSLQDGLKKSVKT